MGLYRKKHEAFPTNPPIHIYINRFNDKFNIQKKKDGYKLELQTPETINLFGSRKRLIDKTKNGKNVPNLEVLKVALLQCSLADNQYQQKFDVLYSFTPNKFYACLLNIELNNIKFLKTSNSEFDDFI